MLMKRNSGVVGYFVGDRLKNTSEVVFMNILRFFVSLEFIDRKHFDQKKKGG